jgi:hypothetical protein
MENFPSCCNYAGVIYTVYEIASLCDTLKGVFMTIIIRKLDNTEHEYLAYTKSLCGKSTYFLYFEDNIWGAVTLHRFIEMLKTFFEQDKAEVIIGDKSLTVKNKMVLDLIKKDQ